MATTWQVTRLRRPGEAGGVVGARIGVRTPAPAGGLCDLAAVTRAPSMPREEADAGAWLTDRTTVARGSSFSVCPSRGGHDVRVGATPGTPPDQRWVRVSEAVERLTAAGATVVREDE
jgi:hypothetical protein